MDLIKQLAIAFALGLLVGLQREWAKAPHAGIRTYPMVTVFGVLCVVLAEKFGGWIPATGLLCLTSLVIISNIPNLRRESPDLGLTSEIALLLMFAVGCILALGEVVVSLVVSGGVMVLLQGKTRLHGMVERFEEKELRAIARLALIGLVILPVLPNIDFGPGGVLNAFKIWLMVVLIVGISLVGYLISKFGGAEKGTLANGILGGLISSTATIASLAGQTRRNPAQSRTAAVVVVIASTIVFVRVLIEIHAAAPHEARHMTLPLVIMLGWMILVSAVFYWRSRKQFSTATGGDPPADIKGAVLFGALYAAVLVAVTLASEYLGDTGVYTVAALSGLTDMDAITLSTARLVDLQKLPADTGWRVILTGGLANLVFKGLLASLLGGPAFRKLIWLTFGFGLLGGGLLIALF